MVNAQSRKFTRIAMEEVTSGLVQYDLTEVLAKVAPKKRSSKESKGH